MPMLGSIYLLSLYYDIYGNLELFMIIWINQAYCAFQYHADCHYADCHYVECHYAECHYAECHYAESSCIISQNFKILDLTYKVSSHLKAN